ncbi:MAG: DNA polymerase III subunit gamma/tau [Fretibacterium sp.]|nr:DNA polymerase III subunit gamma/tau [Fretibacterium sp.]
MTLSLYRRYRPQRFFEVVGQNAAIELLSRSVELERTAHAYLFSGPRGCGKTTAARLLAKAVNCLNREGAEPCCQCQNCLAITAGESLDVIEIDGASNNSVDEVRELKTHVGLVPFASRRKIYIIDEVHMLTVSAFNALLKTLEEPPSHVIFVLATTEPHKVPVTIRSRCQHISFRSIETKMIFNRLVEVCKTEGAEAQEEALWEVARQADGALRDALSMLEQALNHREGELTLAGVEALLGEGSRPALERWLSRWQSPDAEFFSDLHRMLTVGSSPQHFIEELFSLLRNLWLTAQWSDIPDVLDVSEQEREFLKAQAPQWEPARLQRMMSFLAALLPQVRQGMRTDVLSGLLMLEITRLGEETSPKTPSEGGRTRVEVSLPLIAPLEPKAEKTEEAGKAGKAEKAEKKPQKVFSGREAQKEEPSQSPELLKRSFALPEVEWKVCAAPEREELLDCLHDGDFLLYCALLNVPFLCAKDEQRGDVLLLDFPESLRYPYEVLSLSRHRSTLQRLFSRFEGGVFLRLGEEGHACFPIEPEGQAKVGQAAPDLSERLFPDEDSSDEGSFDSGTGEKKAGATVEGVLPFEGLLRDVSRLMSGELLLVRSSSEDGSDELALGSDEDKDENE